MAYTAHRRKPYRHQKGRSGHDNATANYPIRDSGSDSPDYRPGHASRGAEPDHVPRLYRPNHRHRYARQPRHHDISGLQWPHHRYQLEAISMKLATLLLTAVLSTVATTAQAYVGGPPWGLRLPPFVYGPPRPPMAYAPLPILPVMPSPPIIFSPPTTLPMNNYGPPPGEACIVDSQDVGQAPFLNVRNAPAGWPIGMLPNGAPVVIRAVVGNWADIGIGFVFRPLLYCPPQSPSQAQAGSSSEEPPADQYRPPIAGTQRAPVPGAPFERTPADDRK
jgi:hypothetical protein